ncbi:MAG: carbon storage regulator CsrA [Dethiobacter sp.]|jgi:carbon storage regulator|nr:carbon storage regulator CsrA [Dethiobacter sp.]MBS3897529.1 carbon storage regulator CsrA [Dethiobacter sp.]
MLILTRKAGQNLVIGDHITVKILEIKGDAVKIGIEAPKEVAVNRQEVYEAIRQANRAAAFKGSELPRLPVLKK